MKFTRNHLIAGFVVAVGIVASVAFGTHSYAAIWSGQDCSTNAIIKCGVSSPNDLRAKYKASSELQALYGHFGVTSSAINSTMYAGTVLNNGDVVVNGKTVATGAMSVGRHQDDGSGCKGTPFTVAGRTYYQGTTACRFGTNPNYTGQAAYVMLSSDGQFIGAVLKPCGNIIYAKPCPKPVATCNSLTANAITSDMVGAPKLSFNFVTKATASGGATIKNYVYNFGDGTSTTTGATTSHTYKNSGTYNVTVTVNFSINGKSTSSSCKTSVTAYKPTPKPPVVTCDALSLKTISRGTYSLTASASVSHGIANIQQPGAVSGYTFTIKDSKGTAVKTITKSGSALTATSGQFSLSAGTYTAQVVVHSNAGDKTGPQCTVQIAVPAPNQITVCRLSDYKVITINENDFDASKYTKDLSKCQPVQVCDTTTGQITQVYPSQIDNVRYTTDMTKCTPVTPTTPTTPELPHTGASNVVVSLFGAGSLIAAVSYYVASRRALS